MILPFFFVAILIKDVYAGRRIEAGILVFLVFLSLPTVLFCLLEYFAVIRRRVSAATATAAIAFVCAAFGIIGVGGALISLLKTGLLEAGPSVWSDVGITAGGWLYLILAAAGHWAWRRYLKRAPAAQVASREGVRH